jgi:transposase-like protein
MPQLTPIQSQVIAGLLAGKSVSAVARENGIHRSTIYHWRNEHPYFSIVLDQARSRHQVNVYDLVQDLTEQALETVGTMLESDDANLRIRAAQTILRVADPGRLPKGLRTSMEIETMSDGTLAQRAGLDLGPMSTAVECDTIRQNPTLKSEPSRNSRCACGSGLKYKRCCGSIRLAGPADREARFLAGSPA